MLNPQLSLDFAFAFRLWKKDKNQKTRKDAKQLVKKAIF